MHDHNAIWEWWIESKIRHSKYVTANTLYIQYKTKFIDSWVNWCIRKSKKTIQQCNNLAFLPSIKGKESTITTYVNSLAHEWNYYINLSINTHRSLTVKHILITKLFKHSYIDRFCLRLKSTLRQIVYLGNENEFINR